MPLGQGYPPSLQLHTMDGVVAFCIATEQTPLAILVDKVAVHRGEFGLAPQVPEETFSAVQD